MSSMKMSILAARAANPDQRAQIGGKVGCGVMLLTNIAKKNVKAVSIYDQGVFQRRKYKEIEKQIVKETGIPHPLYPRNSPYFTVSCEDFGMPEIPHAIIEKFGEVREFSREKQLYRFPVVFHTDDIFEIYPNRYARYGGEPNYQSSYGIDGQRYCKFLPPVTQAMLAEQKIARIKRPPPRQMEVRGLCDPSVCPEYLSKQCQFEGRLLFYIPGIPSGLVALDTGSEYAASSIWTELNRIKDAFGYLPRINPNKPGAYLYYVTKVQEQRTYFDEHGKKQTGMQWVPKLEADIDVGTLFITGAVTQTALPTTPVAWLSAPKGMPDADVMDVVNGKQLPPGPAQTDSTMNPLDQLTDLTSQLDLSASEVKQYFDVKLGPEWHREAERVGTAIKILSDLSRKGSDGAKAMINITLRLHQLGISANDYMQYARRKYGKNFQAQPAILESMLLELDDLANSGNNSELNYFKAQFAPEPEPA